ncbi:MAG: hypothetical protein GX772_11835, partial [Alcaligenaceae bacterium]|nr:hypothetical protein [Alcaligenaceae bacterium]
ARTDQMWFTQGIPFNTQLTQATLAGSNGDNVLWLNLGGDAASKSYYLLRAEHRHYRGIGVWYVAPVVDVVTADADAFRKADLIRAAVGGALNALETHALPLASSTQLVFWDDFQNGVVGRQRDNLLYEIYANRRVDRRNQRAGDWDFNLNRASNHVFQRDERLAQQKRREEERLAMEKRRALQNAAYEAERQLRTYESLVSNHQANPERAFDALQNDVSFDLFGRSGYTSMVKGRPANVQLVVRVDGKDGQDAKVGWPYDLRLVGQGNLEKQWYLVKGTSSLDTQRSDSDGLPLTLVSANAEDIEPCVENGCTEMTDPLVVARKQFGNPDWTPEAAKAIVDEARQS